MVGRATGPGGELDLEVLGREVMATLQSTRRSARLNRIRIQGTIDSTGLAISVFDRDQKLVYCNQQFLELYNLPKRLGRHGTSFEAILRGRVEGGTAIGQDPEEYVAWRIDFARRHEYSTAILNLNS